MSQEAEGEGSCLSGEQISPEKHLPRAVVHLPAAIIRSGLQLLVLTQESFKQDFIEFSCRHEFGDASPDQRISLCVQFVF